MSIQPDGNRRSTEIAAFAHVLFEVFPHSRWPDIEQRARSAWGTSPHAITWDSVEADVRAVWLRLGAPP